MYDDGCQASWRRLAGLALASSVSAGMSPLESASGPLCSGDDQRPSTSPKPLPPQPKPKQKEAQAKRLCSPPIRRQDSLSFPPGAAAPREGFAPARLGPLVLCRSPSRVYDKHYCCLHSRPISELDLVACESGSVRKDTLHLHLLCSLQNDDLTMTADRSCMPGRKSPIIYA